MGAAVPAPGRRGGGGSGPSGGSGRPAGGPAPLLAVQLFAAAGGVAAVIPAILPIFAGGGLAALLVGAFLPALVAGLASLGRRRAPGPLRLLGYLVAAVALLALLPGAALGALASGGDQLVTGALPAPASGGELGVAVLATFLASAIAVEVVCRGALLAALVPGAVLLVGAMLVGTGGLAQPRWPGVGYVAAAALVVLVRQLFPDSASPGRARAAGPAPLHLTPGPGAGPAIALRVLVGVAIAAAVAVLALPLAAVLPGRHAREPYSLRAAVAPAPRPLDQLSLLATYSATYDGAPQPVFTARTTGADGRSLYWRLATFDRFDGLDWSSSQVFQRAGTRLPVGPALTVATTTVHAVIHPESLSAYLPAPDRPEAVSIPGLGVSVGSGELVLPAGVDLPPEIRLTSVVPAPTASELLESGTTPGPTNPGAPPVPANLTSLAHRIEASSGANPFSRLTSLSDYLSSSPFRLHPPGGSPIGSGYYQVTQLLKTHTGSSEQYAAAFAILARVMGFHARLAVGYTGGRAEAGGTVAFTTRDLKVWPEVELAGIGWQPLPAGPSAIGSGSTAPRQSPPTTAPPATTPPTTAAAGSSSPTTAGSGSAPPVTSPPTTAPHPSSPLNDALQRQREINQAPKPAPPAPSGPATRLPSDAGAGASAGGGGLATWAWGLIGLGGAVVLGLGALVGGKAVRRRRQRRRPDPAAALAAAWEHTLDRLAEHGLRLPASLTAPEVAERAGTSLGDAAAASLRALASAVDGARYDRRQGPAPEAVEQGWAIARQVDAALRARASLPERVRAVLSPAPFTRSRRAGERARRYTAAA